MSKAAEAIARAIVTEINWTKTVTSGEIARLIDSHPDVKGLVEATKDINSSVGCGWGHGCRCHKCVLANALSNWLPSPEKSDE